MEELTALTAAELHALLEKRQVSARDVTAAFLERIDRLDGELNAFIRLDPSAERQASEADARYTDGTAGPLTGIPVALKDNICTAGLETGCGSRILSGFIPPRDSTAVVRLREAGAIIIGKTNMDEFGMGSSTESSIHGATHNPWDSRRVAGGSSGGSAAAVAARLAPLALGSDTGGSIRQPAAFCGVLGLKPTYGRVSRSGLIAYGSSLDQIGPLARTAGDAARLLQCISGKDPQDMNSSITEVEDYRAAAEISPARLCIGLPREYYGRGLDPEIKSALREAADRLEREGAELREVSLPHTAYSLPAYYLVATAEASSNLARYDGVRYGLRADHGRGLRAMYRSSRREGFGDEVKRRIMLGTYALSAGYRESYYGKAQQLRAILSREFADLFEGGVDMLMTPTTPTLPFMLGEKIEDPLEMYLSDIHTVSTNLTGLPAISVPVGSSRSGLPISGQLIGPHFSEGSLLRAASILERWYHREPSPLPAAEDRS